MVENSSITTKKKKKAKHISFRASDNSQRMSMNLPNTCKALQERNRPLNLGKISRIRKRK